MRTEKVESWEIFELRVGNTEREATYRQPATQADLAVLVRLVDQVLVASHLESVQVDGELRPLFQGVAELQDTLS